MSTTRASEKESAGQSKGLVRANLLSLLAASLKQLH